MNDGDPIISKKKESKNNNDDYVESIKHTHTHSSRNEFQMKYMSEDE